MALCVNQSGTWRNITTLCVNQSGTWRNISAGCINGSGTWRRFGFQPTTLGASFGGGYAICMSSNVVWIVSPQSAEVSRNWHSRDDASTRAQEVSGCTGWFVPTFFQFQNPGQSCKSFWGPSPCYSIAIYWVNHSLDSNFAKFSYMIGGSGGARKTCTYCVRAFRCVTY